MNNNEYKNKLINRTYKFSLAIILLVKNVLLKDYATQVITKQLIRSSTSIGANIVEAQASPTRKDFSNFINHSLKSANETRYWLALLRDTSSDTIDASKIKSLLEEAQEISKILGSTVKSLKSKRS